MTNKKWSRVSTYTIKMCQVMDKFDIFYNLHNIFDYFTLNPKDVFCYLNFVHTQSVNNSCTKLFMFALVCSHFCPRLETLLSSVSSKSPPGGRYVLLSVLLQNQNTLYMHMPYFEKSLDISL